MVVLWSCTNKSESASDGFWSLKSASDESEFQLAASRPYLQLDRPGCFQVTCSIELLTVKTWSRCLTDIKTLSLGNILQLCTVRTFYVTDVDSWSDLSLTLWRVAQPFRRRSNNGTILNNMKLVHWPLMGGLLHSVQRGWAWAWPQPAQSPPR